MCEPARMKLRGITAHPAHAPNSVEYASITPVILSEMTSGPLDDASYTAEIPRNQLQHAPKKP